MSRNKCTPVFGDGEGRLGHVSDFWRHNMLDGTWERLAPAGKDDPVLW